MFHILSLKPNKDTIIKDNTSEAIEQNDNIDNEINTSAASVNDNVLNVDLQVQHFIYLFILDCKHCDQIAMKVIMA